jgi:hypothetical protein
MNTKSSIELALIVKQIVPREIVDLIIGTFVTINTIFVSKSDYIKFVNGCVLVKNLKIE